jgi:hypothetical protein
MQPERNASYQKGRKQWVVDGFFQSNIKQTGTLKGIKLARWKRGVFIHTE